MIACVLDHDGFRPGPTGAAALETLTTTGFSDFSSKGSAAWVTRMRPIALVSNTLSASGPLTSAAILMPALLTRTSKWSLAFVGSTKSGLHGCVVSHVKLHELATELGCCHLSMLEAARPDVDGMPVLDQLANGLMIETFVGPSEV